MQPDDVGFLETAEGRALLDAARASRAHPLHQRHRALIKIAASEQVRLVLEQDALRQRARAKVPFAEELLLERVALEQATSWPVACERATRWPGPLTDALVDLGAGIGFDALATAETGRPVLAVERDPVRAALLTANARVRKVSERLQVLCAALETTAFDLPFAFLDPDQRPEGKRARDPEAFSPAAGTWDSVLRRFRAAMVKLPPSVERDFMDAHPFEVVSLDGRARERRLFYGDWGRPLPARRALCLPSGTAIEGEGIQGPGARAPTVGDALLDADTCVHHADLMGDLAARDGLQPINGARAYLVADQPVAASPGTWLRIDATLGFDARSMKTWLREHDIGSLTIRKRGIEARVEDWRKKLKPRGKQRGTLVLTCDPDKRWVALGCFEIREDRSGKGE